MRYEMRIYPSATWAQICAFTRKWTDTNDIPPYDEDGKPLAVVREHWAGTREWVGDPLYVYVDEFCQGEWPVFAEEDLSYVRFTASTSVWEALWMPDSERWHVVMLIESKSDGRPRKSHYVSTWEKIIRGAQ
jgi:hypothetical protein